MVTNSEKNEEENQKPHIVFIVADDLVSDFICLLFAFVGDAKCTMFSIT